MKNSCELSTLLKNKETNLAVIGLGYVGLPLALAFAKKVSVIGYDINPVHLALLREGRDPSRELPEEAFKDCDIVFTDEAEYLRKARFFIITVPTPVNKDNQPDLGPLFDATRTVARVLKPGDCVVYESTVYPGCTEDVCVPLLESASGLHYGSDFKVGYSPERINPGDKKHTLQNTVKVVSGSDETCLRCLVSVYSLVVEAGLYEAPNIMVAEAAKVVENTQRDVNIALINELSILLSKMGINTYDVLKAAGTKWNFTGFSPGLVGGHCISIDPYYLLYKVNKLGINTQIISAARRVNDSMAGYIAKKLLKLLLALGKPIIHSHVLVLGLTFKENVADIRNSKVVNLIQELKSYSIKVDVMDPYADPRSVKQMYGLSLVARPTPPYDAVVVAVAHDVYKNLEESYFLDLCNGSPLLIDIKGSYRGKIQKMHYWSL